MPDEKNIALALDAINEGSSIREASRLFSVPYSTLHWRLSKSEFKIPNGQIETGQSVLLDADGKVKARWVKTKEEPKSPEILAGDFEKAFANFKPKASVKRPLDSDDDRLTVYILTDWHLGLFAWGKETGGPDWDLKIAERVLRETVFELIDRTPPSRHAIALGLGDLLHADDTRNMTSRSGNVLDVDTRHSKTIGALCDLMAETTEAIAKKHELVEVVFKPGNHDENSTQGLRHALRMYWRNSERVQVDTSANPFYFKQFGTNLIGGVHGDKTKIADLPLVMANTHPKEWGDTTTRHFHTGHIHHDTLKEVGGVHMYSHRAPTAQDAYHAAAGYLSGRSMRAFNYHKTKGSIGTIEVEIK